MVFSFQILILFLILNEQNKRRTQSNFENKLIDRQNDLNEYCSNNDKSIKETKQKFEIIDSFFLSILISTTIMILAVDFKVFPRRNCKIEHFGLGLMDAGAIYFLAMNAILSPEVKFLGLTQSNDNSNKLKVIKKNVYSCSILLIIGLIRLVTVKNLNYQEHVSEYGVHMNFFLLLVLIKFIGMVLTLISTKLIFNPIFGFLLILLHEILLKKFGFSDYIQQDGYRSTFLDKNKESFFTLFGYIGFYLSCFYWASKIYQKLINSSSIDQSLFRNSVNSTFNSSNYNSKYNTIYFCLKYGLFYFLIFLLSNHFSEPISRRNVNMAFTCLMLSTICLIGSFEFIWTILYDRFYLNTNETFKRDHKSTNVKLIIQEAYTKNGLITFLFSNILTGFVNMSTNTMQLSDLNAIILLFTYSFIVAISICFLDSLNNYF